jgi:hypothetical protein
MDLLNSDRIEAETVTTLSSAGRTCTTCGIHYGQRGPPSRRKRTRLGSVLREETVLTRRGIKAVSLYSLDGRLLERAVRSNIGGDLDADDIDHASFRDGVKWGPAFSREGRSPPILELYRAGLMLLRISTQKNPNPKKFDMIPLPKETWTPAKWCRYAFSTLNDAFIARKWMLAGRLRKKRRKKGRFIADDAAF